MQKQETEPLTFGSLFAGIGGLDLGFERAGLVCKWQVEINPYAQKVLAKHWPEVRRHDDVRTWPKSGTEYVDVIAGGFPCQDISFAGKGAGLQGERSGLFYEAMRIVREMGPRYVVLENVAALLVRGMDQVLGTLAEIGYDAEWHCIPAAAVGAPHIRDRVFVLAHSRCKLRQPRRDDKERETFKRSESASIDQRCSQDMADPNSSGLEERQGQDSGRTWAICRSKPCRSDWWAVEPDVGRVANGIPNRVDRLKGLGNAIVPQVAEYIGHRLANGSQGMAFSTTQKGNK